MKKIKKNRLIMKFMGLKPALHCGRFSISKDHCHCSEYSMEKALNGFASIAKYSSDWNWIMEVVEKIGSFNEPDNSDAFIYNVHISLDKVIINTCEDSSLGYKEIVINDNGSTLIEMLYNAIIMFIEWYNERVNNFSKAFNRLCKDDWVNEMLNQSDYTMDELCLWDDFDNSVSFQENSDLFEKWHNEQKK